MEKFPPFIGSLEANKKFIAAHPKFFDALPKINDLANRVLDACPLEDENEDRQAANIIIWELASLICEDFDDVVLLCAHGHPRGGIKILRHLFESTVTLFEIDEADANARLFFDYDAIDKYKMAVEIQEAYKNQFFSKERLEQLKAARDAVIGNYMGKCPKCGDPRPNPSWLKSGLVAVGKKRGFKGSLLIHAYYNALTETHPKMEAIFHRQRLREGDTAPEDAAATLTCAHVMLLENMRVLIERFKLKDLQALHQECWEEYFEIWPASDQFKDSSPAPDHRAETSPA